MNDGFIKLHRKFLKWEWYDNANVMRLFIHCLLKANYKPKEWCGTTIERGEYVTSLSELSVALKLSVQQIRTAINKLKSTHEITYRTTNKYTIITILNYSDYQDIKNENNTRNNTQENKQITNKEQTNNKQITTTKESKELKNRKKEYKEKEKEYKEKEKESPKINDLRAEQFEIFWNLYDKKVDRKRCRTAFFNLPKKEIEALMIAVPGYVAATPDKQYRKNPSTYLYNKSWNNEIVRGQGSGAISNSWTAEDAAGIGAYYSTEEE